MNLKRQIAAGMATLLMIAQLTGCTAQKEGTYRGGVLIEPGPLALNDHYAFTLLDKWRISHSWLSGPVDIDYCSYSRRDNGRGADRFFERDGKLIRERVSGAKDDFGKKYISNPQAFVYGTNSVTGKFEGYLPFCTYWFRDIWAGVSVLLVKPDPIHGTDRWVAGSQRVTINGLTWLKQSAPIRTSAEAAQQNNAWIERWVLEIPQSSYWLVIGLGGSRSDDGKTFGIDRNPEKFSRLLDLVHQMVASVRVEPIDTPSAPPKVQQRPAERQERVKS